MTKYEALCQRLRAQHGEKFSEEGLSPKWKPYYESGARVEVNLGIGMTRRGHVGCTTGWKPSFMLLAQRNSTGSWILLDDRDEVVKVVSR